jgi:hypothetical protein
VGAAVPLSVAIAPDPAGVEGAKEALGAGLGEAAVGVGARVGG